MTCATQNEKGRWYQSVWIINLLNIYFLIPKSVGFNQKMSIISKWGKSCLIRLILFPLLYSYLLCHQSSLVSAGSMDSPGSLLLCSPPQPFSPDSGTSPSSLHLKHQSEIKWENNLEGKKWSGLLSNGHVHLSTLSILCYLRSLDRPAFFGWNKDLMLAEYALFHPGGGSISFCQ